MADDADMAFEIAAEHVARGLSSIAVALPAGVAGECDECGEMMPRLVGGRCAFCRDGRRPPLSFFDADRAPPAIVAAFAPAAKEPTMPSTYTLDKHTISVPASGDLLRAIRARSERDELPLGQAVTSLIAELLAITELPEAVSSAASEPIAVTAFSIAEVPLESLLTEIGIRAERGVPTPDYEAARDRAVAAESTLASMKALLG